MTTPCTAHVQLLQKQANACPSTATLATYIRTHVSLYFKLYYLLPCSRMYCSERALERACTHGTLRVYRSPVPAGPASGRQSQRSGPPATPSPCLLAVCRTRYRGRRGQNTRTPSPVGGSSRAGLCFSARTWWLRTRG